MDGAVFPSCCLAWGRLLTRPPLETPGHSQSCLGQSLLGTLLFSLGSWCTQGFVCALQESVSPVLCKFCNQIPLPSKVVISWGFSVPLPDPQVWKSVVGPRTFLTVWEFLWYDGSAVCGSSAQRLYDGANYNLLPGGLYATCWVTQVCCSHVQHHVQHHM